MISADALCAFIEIDEVDDRFNLTLEAVFQGDNALNYTLYGVAPDDTRYALCTTLQYFGYKPAANTTTLTVNPQGTDLLTGNKTPEQLQAEAEQSGLLEPRPWFSFFYPWFRLHFIGKYKGQDIINVGVGLLPFGDFFDFPYNPWKNKIKEQFDKVLQGVFLGIIATEAAFWALSNYGPVAFGIALGLYFGYKFYNLFVANLNSVESLWISLISTVTSLTISIWTGISTLVPFVFHALIAGAAAVRSLPWGFLCKLIMVPINIWLLIMTCIRLSALGAL